MKVKELIKQLNTLDPEMKVTWGTASGSESGIVTGASRMFSGRKGGKEVFEASIDCKTTHNFGERC